MSLTNITTFSASALAALTISEIKSLTSTQLSSLVASQLGELTATQVSILPVEFLLPEALTGIATSSINGITIKNLMSDQIAALTVNQIGAFTAKKIANFSPEQLPYFTISQIAAIDVSALDSEQVSALSASQLAALGNNFSMLNSQAFEGLNAGNLAGLSTTQLNALPSEKIAALKPSQLNALSSSQFSNLSSGALSAIAPETVKAIESSISETSYLTPIQLAALTPAKISSFTPLQLSTLTATQAAALKPAQIAVLSAEKVGALSTVAIAALKPQVIKSMDLSALDSDDVAALSDRLIAYLKNDTLSPEAKAVYDTRVSSNATPTGAVTISGSSTQGQTLTADTSSLADLDGLGTFSYQWKKTIGGVTSDINVPTTQSSLPLTQAEVGAQISVTVSYTDGGGTVETVSSTSTSAVLNVNDAPIGNVTISGTPAVGQTLTVSNDLTDIDVLGEISYQWEADGTAISNATNSTYTLTQSELNKVITVTASYTDLGGTAENVTSAETATIAPPPPTFNGSLDNTPTFSGTLVVLDSTVTIFDTELAALDNGYGNYVGATLTLKRQGVANSADIFDVSGDFYVQDGILNYTEISLGTFSQTNGVLTINFTIDSYHNNSYASQNNINALLSSISYRNTSFQSETVPIEWIFNNGSGETVTEVINVAVEVAPNSNNFFVMGELSSTDEINTFRSGNYVDIYELTDFSDGDFVAIALNADFDAYLQVVRNGSVIANDDDSGNGSNSLLTYIYQTGDLIYATSYGSGETGQYTLTANKQFSPPTTPQTYSGNTYILSSNTTCQEAENQAVFLGGHLVTVNDQTKQDWLINTYGGSELFWIGLTDKDEEGTFNWISNNQTAWIGTGLNGQATSGSYTNWNIDNYGNYEPNNSNNEDYTVMNWDYPGKWNDWGEGNSARGIIEIPFLNTASSATNLNEPETYTEDSPLNLTDIVVTDTNSANVITTLTLSNPAAGSLSVATSNLVTSTFNTITGVWNAKGAIADVNTLLAGLTFVPAVNFNDDFTIATSVSDGIAPAITGSKSFTGIAVNNAPTLATPPVGAILNPATGNYYLLSTLATWHGAENQAVAIGGHLVTINDAEENAWLVSTFDTEGLWIGLSDEATEGAFVWAGGSSASYRNWNSTADDYTGGGITLGQDYVYMNAGNPGKWDDETTNGSDSIISLRGIIEIVGTV